jgi:uncharacterized protein YjlB
MTWLEDVKKAAPRLTGWRRPSVEQMSALRRKPKVTKFFFADDGMIPNHPHWPLVILRHSVELPQSLDPAAIFEDIFASNGWADSWRGEVYSYLHYHSRIHEVLGVACGSAKIRFGGNKGRTLTIKRGDVAILPAGTGHQCVSASTDFMVVGAYPPSGTYDECGPTTREHARGVKSVRKVARPRKDPIFGTNGPLLQIWKAKV